MLIPENPPSNTHPPTLYITLLPCPPGFALKGLPPQTYMNSTMHSHT